jgi:vacuolar-type H+-ATPase subunit F/Vma7
MARVVVLSAPGQADGYRLAGCATVVAPPGAEAAAALRHLSAATDVGVLLVGADLWSSIDERLRGEAERLARPVVMPIPAGERASRTTRTQLLGEMFQRAIGFRIQISAGDGR